jgi:hypothetical protein
MEICESRFQWNPNTQPAQPFSKIGRNIGRFALRESVNMRGEVMLMLPLLVLV